MKRSLILAGGGMKVGYQAGVLQVWLDEAGLQFDHADGASGGCFNLAMLCQGMSGTRIADNWRNMHPSAGVDVAVLELLKLGYSESLFTLDAYRKNIFPAWGLDWNQIKASKLEATFNVFNFSTKEVKVIEPRAMDEEMLCACVSLPVWFPPVRRMGDIYIDAVFLTDGHIEEAIRRGADEIWVIWTVSERNEWNDGFVAQYFQIIETVADGNYFKILRRIEANNAAIDAGQAGEFGRKIAVKELRAEVPIHYLVNFSQDRMAETVNLGVKQAREWCAKQGIALKPAEGYPDQVHRVETHLSFTEEMRGYWARGESEFERGAAAGKQQQNTLMFHLTISIHGVNRFVVDPEHDTDDVQGYVECPALGGRRPVEKGRFNLFVDQADPHSKRMFYRLFFRDAAGAPFTMEGHKRVDDDKGFDVWNDTTTLFTRLWEGHVEADAQTKLVGAGILRLDLADFLKQLTTFRVEAPGGSVSDRAGALTQFGKLFMGKLWDVYAQRALTWGPF